MQSSRLKPPSFVSSVSPKRSKGETRRKRPAALRGEIQHFGEMLRGGGCVTQNKRAARYLRDVATETVLSPLCLLRTRTRTQTLWLHFLRTFNLFMSIKKKICFFFSFLVQLSPLTALHLSGSCSRGRGKLGEEGASCSTSSLWQ